IGISDHPANDVPDREYSDVPVKFRKVPSHSAGKGPHGKCEQQFIIKHNLQLICAIDGYDLRLETKRGAAASQQRNLVANYANTLKLLSPFIGSNPGTLNPSRIFLLSLFRFQETCQIDIEIITAKYRNTGHFTNRYYTQRQQQ
ncbi:hypothetical protein TNCV_1459591, partial [Trichonephila clavipes]